MQPCAGFRAGFIVLRAVSHESSALLRGLANRGAAMQEYLWNGG